MQNRARAHLLLSQVQGILGDMAFGVRSTITYAEHKELAKTQDLTTRTKILQ